MAQLISLRAEAQIGRIRGRGLRGPWTEGPVRYFGGPKPAYGLSGTMVTISSMPSLKRGSESHAARTSDSAGASHMIAAPGISARAQIWRRMPDAYNSFTRA